MSRIGVNTADSNAGRIKSGDRGSLITLTLDNIEGETVEFVEWVRAYDTKDITRYIDIPDYRVYDSQIFMTMPEMPRGEFNIEIKDEWGRIYPAEGTLKLSVLASTKDSIDVYYVTYKDLILEEVEPMVEQYITDNPENFRGPTGKQFNFEDFTEEELNIMKDKVIESLAPELENIINPPIHDPYDSPGPRHLVAGDKNAGFFGFVKPHEFGDFTDGTAFNGENLALQVGLSAGSLMESKTPWMKFSWQGKILFVPLKPIRHSISWDHIYQAGAVYDTGSTISDGEQFMLDNDGNYTPEDRISQDAKVSINGAEYAVRLMKGAGSDPTDTYSDSDRGSEGSNNEWNALILPLHERAPDNFRYNQYAVVPTADWGTGLTDADLRTHLSFGVGSYSWMQETRDTIEGDEDGTVQRVYRGGYGASTLASSTSWNTYSARGWRPVLELL